MTDISDLRAWDEIEVVIRAKVVGDGTVMTTNGRHPRWLTQEFIAEVSTSVTVVRPEIIPGKPYVDAEGKLYVGRARDRLTHVDDEGVSRYHHATNGLPEYRPLPPGLRPAKVVPEP